LILYPRKEREKKRPASHREYNGNLSSDDEERKN
jgi:hypothetical protein